LNDNLGDGMQMSHLMLAFSRESLLCNFGQLELPFVADFNPGIVAGCYLLAGMNRFVPMHLKSQSEIRRDGGNRS
jgi:hypothetical protein